MPGMFSRRRGSSASRASAHNMPLNPTTTSSAALAASQAFLNRPSTSSGLSSAAAAAALRSATSSPEPVGSIQTKRMIRRGSVSSTGSGSFVGGRGGAGPGTLQRRDSQGSMTERTFRSPSPGRANGTTSPSSNAPPVPSIPANITTGHNRSWSLDRTKRNASAEQDSRSMSLDRNSIQPRSGARPGKRLSNVAEEMERADSNRNNVNFSRPRSSQPSSPTSPTMDTRYTHGTGNWFSEAVPVPSQPNQDTSQTALEQKIARIHAAEGRPVKRDHSASSSQGSYLNRAGQYSTIGTASTTRPQATSEVPMETVMVYDSSSRTFVPKLRPKPQVTSETALPVVAQPPPPTPGTYDPNTRKIVPGAAAAVVAPSQQRPQRPALDTDLEPPPRNPARLSPTSVGKQLQNKPSVAREESAQEGASGTGRTMSMSTAPAKMFAPPNIRKQRSGSLDVPRASFDPVENGRTSPSPQRSAHFSASPVSKSTIHNPPPRNVSPAKPALKHHSPSSSIRTSSPMTNMSSSGPKSPASETSETTSQASQDAFSSRKKKTVRVSFDEQLHAIEAATAISTPTALRSSVLDDDDDDDMMKPRPALPSFGSVRKQRTPQLAEKVTEMAPERHDVSNDHLIGGILRNAKEAKTRNEPVPPEVTSKETAGYISDESDDISAPLATSTPAKSMTLPDAAMDSSPDDPKVRDFAPKTQSDTLDVTGVPAINLLPPTPGIEEESKSLTTEGTQSAKARSSMEIKMPGGWDKQEDNEAASSGAAIATTSSVIASEPPVSLPDEDPIIYSSPVPASPNLAAIDEDTDTDDSAEFSDAAEDLSELENGGYASLNAIAVSPIIKPVSVEKVTVSPVSTVSPPESPSVQRAPKRFDAVATEDGGSGDWGAATAYWSQLSKERRREIEREALSSDDESRPSSPAVRKPKKNAATATVVPSAPQQQNQASASRATQPAQPTLKKTMRAAPVPSPAEGDVHMRRSMRAGGGKGVVTGVRDGPQPAKERKKGFQQRTMRPTSSGGMSNTAVDTVPPRMRDQRVAKPQEPAYSKVQAITKPPPAPVMTAKLQRQLSNDSDSESSFKKKRRPRASADTSGRYSMKRSMRGGPVDAAPAAREERPVSPTPARGKGKDSFSIRSLSPSGSLFGRKKQVESVKQSLRGSSMDGGPRMTMRNAPPSRGTAKPTKAQPTTTSRFKSRFADSDDSGEDLAPKRGIFRSRFTDSDDEDDDIFIPADLTPVRGIPRRQGQNDGDSTDLEDEDDDDISRKMTRTRPKMSTPMVPDPADIEKAMEAARKKLGIVEIPPPESQQGASLQQGSLRNSHAEPKTRTDEIDFTSEKKRRGFMGSILRRNRGSTASVPQISSPGIHSPEDDVPFSPLATIAPQPTQSPEPTRRPQSPVSPNGKLIRRSSAQAVPTRIKMTRGASTFSTATAPPTVGDADLSGGDWPLPPVPPIPNNIDLRPQTSDGSPVKDRAGSVRFADVGPPVYSQRTGKKKRFGLLRRAFGLND